MYEKAKKENKIEEKMLEREISLKSELSSRLRYSLMKHFSSSENLKKLVLVCSETAMLSHQRLLENR